MQKILLVEDAPEFQIMVKRVLSHLDVIVTDDPDQVVSILERDKVDLILLDISLPKRDGYSVLSELQLSPHHSGIPVLCLTGKNNVSDKVTAFSLGAEDYIAKPFDPIEFRARVDAKLAKLRKSEFSQLVSFCGPLKIDQSSHTVLDVKTSKEIPLTQTEYKILVHFAKSQGKVYSREQLLSAILGR